MIRGVNNSFGGYSMAERQSASDPHQTRPGPFGSAPDLNGPKTGLPPELFKRSLQDSIRTPKSDGIRFGLSCSFGPTMGLKKSVAERRTSPLYSKNSFFTGSSRRIQVRLQRQLKFHFLPDLISGLSPTRKNLGRNPMDPLRS